MRAMMFNMKLRGGELWKQSWVGHGTRDETYTCAGGRRDVRGKDKKIQKDQQEAPLISCQIFVSLMI